MNVFFTRFFFFVSISSLFLFSACDDDSNPGLDLLPIAEKTESGFTVKIKAEKNLEVGMNHLYWEVVNSSGEVQTLQSITIIPMMHMMTMDHSCPVLAPVPSKSISKNWESGSVFIMPSGEMGSWEMQVSAVLESGTSVVTNIPVTIGSSWKLASFKMNNVSYWWTWDSVNQPATGNGTYNLWLFKRINMMEYAPVAVAEAQLYPYMDMGGGKGHSTTFSQPTAKGNGEYTGTINFSMAGEWTVTVNGTLDGVPLPDAVFTLNVASR